MPKILNTHIFIGGNVLEIAQIANDRFDITHYDNGDNPDYDRWEFQTRGACEAIFAVSRRSDDQVAFTALCVASGGK